MEQRKNDKTLSKVLQSRYHHQIHFSFLTYYNPEVFVFWTIAS